MSYLILRDYISIKNTFKRLFSYDTRKKRRVILINYLDEFIPRIIPDFYNVEIFCYPQPGNIDPYVLEELQQKGAKIFFTDPINMNLYYVDKKGFIIGSANYNFTKYALKCFEKIFDVLIYIDDYTSIDINIILNSIDTKLIDVKDIEDLKEKHHVYWKTLEGFEYYTNITTENRDECYYINNNIRIIDKIIKQVRSIKNIFQSQKHNHSSIEGDVKDIANEDKCGIKATGEIKKQNQAMNIYCVSKGDILEMLSNRLKNNKRIIH